MLFYSSQKDQATTSTGTFAEISIGERYLVNDSYLKGAIIQVESFDEDLRWYSYFFVFRPDNMLWPSGGPYFFLNSELHSSLEKVDYQLLPGNKVCYYGPKDSYGLGNIFPPKGTEGTIISVEPVVGGLKDSYIEVLWPEGTVQPNKHKNGQPISHIWSTGLLKKAE